MQNIKKVLPNGHQSKFKTVYIYIYRYRYIQIDRYRYGLEIL